MYAGIPTRIEIVDINTIVIKNQSRRMAFGIIKTSVVLATIYPTISAVCRSN
jgi:hypothetical protein